MQPNLVLMSHPLCPYVQRAIISLETKGVPYERKYIDLAAKPGWFSEISPLGKTPVLSVDKVAIFESSAILEYLEDTQKPPLHPKQAIKKAQHRAWIEFGSATLIDIAGFYSAKDAELFSIKQTHLAQKFTRLENALHDGPYFDGTNFSLVDAVFGPVFRYFDVFDQIGDFGVLANTPKVNDWRRVLEQHPTIRNAVTSDYNSRLWDFLLARKSHLSSLMPQS